MSSLCTTLDIFDLDHPFFFIIFHFSTQKNKKSIRIIFYYLAQNLNFFIFKGQKSKIKPEKSKMSKTRAGALAGVGLALDPEGNKSVLIQPSSFEKNTLNVTFLDFLTAEVQLIMILDFCLVTFFFLVIVKFQVWKNT